MAVAIQTVCRTAVSSERDSQLKRACKQKSGFLGQGMTLIETLLALAISAFIASVAFELLLVHLRAEVLVRTRVRNSQEFDGAVRDLRDDLSRVITRYNASRTGTPQSLTVEEEKTEKYLRLIPDVVSQPLHFHGTLRTLSVLAANGPRMSGPIQSSQKLVRVDRVLWFCGGENAERVPSGRVGYHIRYLPEDCVPRTSGLVRISVPDSYTEPTFRKESAIVQCESAEDVIFGYYDGSRWRTSWDCDKDGGYPLAVSVTLHLADASETTVFIALP